MSVKESQNFARKYCFTAQLLKAHLIRCWQNLGAVCFWQPIPSVLNLVVAAVLRDSLCVVSLLPCVADKPLNLTHGIRLYVVYRV